MKLETALKLEKVVEKLITSRLQSLNPPENFYRAKDQSSFKAIK